MIRRVQRTLTQGFSANLDLALLWLASVVAWPLVPASNPLARPDLTPWLIATLAAALALRGRRLGAGPHPSLQPRFDAVGALARRLAVVLTPVALFCTVDAANSRELIPAVLALLSGVAALAGLAVGHGHGLTAWQPGVSSEASARAATALVLVGAALGLGAAAPWLGSTAVEASATLGLACLAAGLADGRARHLAQRRAAGNRDGSRWRPELFPFALAALGPGIGFYLLHCIFRPLGGLDFDQAYAASLFVLVWVGLIWPRPEPIARAVLLHEVVPVSGQDLPPGDAASPFDEPPEGALRLDPRRMRRTRVVHPWLVPVRASRISDLDDPARPLVERQPAPMAAHALGDAAFEPDPLTNSAQIDCITLHLRGGDSAVSLSRGEGLTRRVVILRPFLPPGASAAPRTPTYAWEREQPEQSVQQLDPTLDAATLRDGDVLVLSIEGVARAYEIELGAPVFTDARLRPPQLEDYVGVS